jgi:23S rRNA (pseudouridine1915-N3)-methyltransferase
MRLQVLAIGRLKTGPEKLLAEDYATRIEQIKRKSGITGFEVKSFQESQAQSIEQRVSAEATDLWTHVPAGGVTVLLDERGKAINSAAFAKILSVAAAEAVPAMTVLIGGPDGHAPESREKAAHVLSFGAMTWPHRLVRIMLLEQIYRALTILQNHPYHRV